MCLSYLRVCVRLSLRSPAKKSIILSQTSVGRHGWVGRRMTCRQRDEKNGAVTLIHSLPKTRLVLKDLRAFEDSWVSRELSATESWIQGAWLRSSRARGRGVDRRLGHVREAVHGTAHRRRMLSHGTHPAHVVPGAWARAHGLRRVPSLYGSSSGENTVGNGR